MGSLTSVGNIETWPAKILKHLLRPFWGRSRLASHPGLSGRILYFTTVVHCNYGEIGRDEKMTQKMRTVIKSDKTAILSVILWNWNRFLLILQPTVSFRLFFWQLIFENEMTFDISILPYNVIFLPKEKKELIFARSYTYLYKV